MFSKTRQTMISLVILCIITVVVGITTSCSAPLEDTVQYGSIQGKALYSNGNDHSGIVLTLDKTDGLRTITKDDGSRAIISMASSKADGSFSFNNLEPGTYTIYASSNDSVEKAVSTNVVVKAADTVTTEDLKLTATGSISGYVTLDSGSNGNVGFLVFLAGTSYVAVTNDTGYYCITGVPAGTDYQLVVSKGNFTSSDVTTCTVSAHVITNAGLKNISSSSLSSGASGALEWKGSMREAPLNPSLHWAYFNTEDGCSYIYDGSKWTLLAAKGDQGEQGIQGKTGADGTSGADGSSIIWLGELDEAPESPVAMNAYYNKADGCSYIFNGTKWNLLASKGEQGIQGETGPQGPQGESSTSGTSITWKGSSAVAPANPGLYWAYYNTEDGSSYIFDGNSWTIFAARGAQGEQGPQGESGSDGAAGADGISIVWLGSFSSVPDKPVKNNAFYYEVTGCSYIYDGIQWTLLASKGGQGEQGPQGTPGTSITWKGSSAVAPANPSLYWAYHNTEDGNSYIFDGNGWTILAARGAQGEQGIQGESGADGAAGADGISIIWLGSFDYVPEKPTMNNAFYYEVTGCSYIYNGIEWSLLASKGDQGEQGPQGETGPQGPQGETGAPGEAGVSITWKGSSVSAPENPDLYWAYFNIEDGCSYIFNGSRWTMLAQKGDAGESGVAGADGQAIVWKGSHISENDLKNPEKYWAFFNPQDGCSYIYNGEEWVLLARAGETVPSSSTGDDSIRIPVVYDDSDNTIDWYAVEDAYCYEIWVETDDGKIAESVLIPTTSWNLEDSKLFAGYKANKQDISFKYRIRSIADPSVGKDNSSWSVMYGTGYYDFVANNPYGDEHKQYGLGKTVNLIEGSYTDVVSGKTSIFDKMKMNNIEVEEDSSKHGKGHSEMREGSSIEEYLESCSVSVKTKLGVKETLFGVTYGMKFEVSSGYSATVETRTEMYFLNFVSEYIGKEYSFSNFNDPSKFEGFLSAEFLNDARRTQDNWAVSGNLEDFIREYGTHIITDAIVGAKFSANYTKIGNKESFGEKESVKTALEESAGVKDLASFEVGLELGLEAEQFASSENVSVSASFDFIGGSNFGALPVMNGSNIGKIEEEYSKWASATSNEEAYALIDVANGSLFFVWDFLPDDEFHLLKEKLTEYFLGKDLENYEAIKDKIGKAFADTVTDVIVYSFDENNPGFESLSNGNEKTGIIKNVKDLLSETIERVNYGYDAQSLNVPSLDFYDFCGWYSEDGVKVSDKDGRIIVSDVPGLIEDGKWALENTSAILYSRWEKKADYSDYVYLSESNPLNVIGNNPSGKYLLIENINYHIGNATNNGSVYEMINDFEGILDGGGHAIEKLVLPYIEGSEVGFFGNNRGIIRNLAFINCGFTKITNPANVNNSTMYLYLGMVCGRNYGIIENTIVKECKLNDNSIGRNSGESQICILNSGLICGSAEIGSLIIKSGSVKCEMTSSAKTWSGGQARSCVAGIVAKNSGEISNCYSYGNNLTGYCDGMAASWFRYDHGVYVRVGGLVGEQTENGKLTKCLVRNNSLVARFGSCNIKGEMKDEICAENKDTYNTVSDCFDSHYLPSSFSTDIWDSSVNPPVVKYDWKCDISYKM